MSTKIEFETPENIQVAYEPAGLGTRFVAWFVDNILLTFVMIVIILVVVCSGIITEQTVQRVFKPLRDIEGPVSPEDVPQVLMYFVGLGLLIWGLGSFFYYGASELLLRGQTVGKRLSGIRVVRLDGFSLEPGGVFVRNIFRVIDHIPVLWIVPLVSARSQRLGDMVAGTIVVVDRPQSISSLRQLLSQRPHAEAKFTFDTPALQRARPHDFEAVERLLERWNELNGERREQLLEQIVPALATRLATDRPAPEDRLEFLKDLLAAEYRRQHRGLG